MTALIVFLLVFSVIVTLHEFGHYYVAKKSGVLVREFAIGMGPKIASWRKNETTFTIRALPLGGYVRMAGNDDDVEPIKAGQLVYIKQNDDDIVTCIDTQEQPSDTLSLPLEVVSCDLTDKMNITGYVHGEENVQTFVVDNKAMYIETNGTILQVAPRAVHLESASPLKRIAIYLAGPINNFLLSIFVFTALAFIMGSVSSNSNRVIVQPNGALAQAGVQDGDVITSINNQSIQTFDDIRTVVTNLRAQNETEVLVTYQSNNQDKQAKVTLQDGYLGVTSWQETSFSSKISYGFTQTIRVIQQVWLALVAMVMSGFNLNNLGGPVAIVQASGEVAKAGIVTVFAFLAMISANLGVMNLLPIPGLDGGKILLALIEMLRGKPIRKEYEMAITMIGALLLVGLMIAVTFNDIMRLFSSR